MLGEALELPAFKVQVLDLQRTSIGDGIRIRVAYRVTAGRSAVTVFPSEAFRVVADGVPRAVSRTFDKLTGRESSSVRAEAGATADAVSEFNIPDTTDHLVLRFADRQQGGAVARRLPAS